MNRLIDADVLIEILTTAIRNMKGMAKFLNAEDDHEIKMEIKAYTDILNGVKEQPTIEPDLKWIPVSERLPEKEVVYIISVHCDDRNFITFDNFCSYKHGWKKWSNQEVLAWMPLPEPYKGEK